MKKSKVDKWRKNYKTWKDCRGCKHLIKQEFYNTIFENFYHVVNYTCDLAGIEYNCIKRNKECFDK